MKEDNTKSDGNEKFHGEDWGKKGGQEGESPLFLDFCGAQEVASTYLGIIEGKQAILRGRAKEKGSMKTLDWISRTWVLALTLGLIGASCATQVITDRRPPTADRRLPTSIEPDATTEQNRRVDTAHQESLTATEPDAATKATIQTAYGQLPLHFEPNQGQTDEQVHFLSRGRGYTLFLTSTEASAGPSEC